MIINRWSYLNLLLRCYIVSNFVCTVKTILDNQYSGGDRARYDNYRLYYVELKTEEQVKIFKELTEMNSYMFFSNPRETGQEINIVVSAHKIADFNDLLIANKFNYRILIMNMQEKIDSNYREVRPISTNPIFFDWSHYYHLESIYEWLQKLVNDFPKQVTLLDMGNSTEGLPIKGVRIAFDEYNDPKNKTTVFIESGIHAREWIAPATATYLIHQLLTSRQQEVQWLARIFNWIIFPVINPDGYKTTFQSDRMWRKNRARYGNCRGVDLNRNYPESWSTIGASNEPCFWTFSGPSAGSEVETQRLMNFMEDNAAKYRIRTYFSLHSYSQMIMFPYGYTSVHVENYDELKEIGRLASERIQNYSGRKYTYGSVYETVYPASGASTDWVFSNFNLPITFTFELRGPPDDEDIFLLPAKQIRPTAKEALSAITVIMQEAMRRNLYNCI